jgi:hypothetical protein
MVRKGRPAQEKQRSDNSQERKVTHTIPRRTFELPALTIARLYRRRWQVELFFKWIKQHLRIKAFLGNSDNAVKTQVWIALSIYVLVAILKKKSNSPLSMGEILQILSVNTFEKTPVFPLLCPENDADPEDTQPNQLRLFDF